MSALQVTISSLESRVSPSAARDMVDQSGTPPGLAVAPAAGADQGQDSVGDTLHHVVCQLRADGEELDAISETVDQVDILTYCMASTHSYNSDSS